MDKELDKKLKLILAWYKFALAMNDEWKIKVEEETIKLIKEVLKDK